MLFTQNIIPKYQEKPASYLKYKTNDKISLEWQSKHKIQIVCERDVEIILCKATMINAPRVLMQKVDTMWYKVISHGNFMNKGKSLREKKWLFSTAQ